MHCSQHDLNKELCDLCLFSVQNTTGFSTIYKYTEIMIEPEVQQKQTQQFWQTKLVCWNIYIDIHSELQTAN